MLRLRPIKNNMNELELDNDIKVLFSYNTPVAFKVLTPEGMEYYKTSTFYSKTTSRHINSWLPKGQAKDVSQEQIDRLFK